MVCISHLVYSLDRAAMAVGIGPGPATAIMLHPTRRSGSDSKHVVEHLSNPIAREVPWGHTAPQLMQSSKEPVAVRLC